MSATTSQPTMSDAVSPPSGVRRIGAAVGLLLFIVSGGVVLTALVTGLAAGAVVLLTHGLG